MTNNERRNERLFGSFTSLERQEIERVARAEGITLAGFVAAAVLQAVCSSGSIYINYSYLEEYKKNNTSPATRSKRAETLPEHYELADRILAQLAKWSQADKIAWVKREGLAAGIALSGFSVAEIQEAWRFAFADKFGRAKWSLRVMHLPHWLDGKTFAELVRWAAGRKQGEESPQAARELTAEQIAERKAAWDAGAADDARVEQARAEQDAALRAAGHDPAVLSAKRRAELYLELRTGRAQDFSERVSLPVDALCSPTKGAA